MSSVATNTMMRLPASELMTMRDEFEAEEDGLTLPQFVRVMLRRARHTSKRRYEKQARAKRMTQRHIPKDQLEPAPSFESDDSDIDESNELNDASGVIRPMVGIDGRANLGAVDDLCELFDQIDVNGDAHLEWEEFTSFVIEHGMAAAETGDSGSHDRYLERSVTAEPIGWRPHGGGGPGPLKLYRWIPELRLLCICAAGAWGLFAPFPRAAAAGQHIRPVFLCSLSPADGAVAASSPTDDKDESKFGGGASTASGAPSFGTQASLSLADEGDDASGDGASSTVRGASTVGSAAADAAPRSTVKDAVIECLDVIFAPKDELLIALCSDLTLRFYHMSSRQSVHEETVRPTGAARLGLPHCRAAWWAGALLEGRHIGARLMFLAGPRASITVLAVRPFDVRPRPGQDRDKGSPPPVTPLEDLQGHTDVVTDILVLDQPRTIVGPPSGGGGTFGADEEDVLPREMGLMATASMDRAIKLWELPSMTCVSTLEGHAAGVRSLSYDRAQHVLLSAGFEFGIRAWGVTGHQAFPLFSLEGGHATSIRKVAAAPGGSRNAVSLDDNGVLCWWDTSRDSASSATDRLTHAVELDGEECQVVEPLGFGVDVEMAQRRQREAARARSLQLDKEAESQASETLASSASGTTLLRPATAPRRGGAPAEDGASEREVLDAATAAAAIAYSTNAISLACGGKRGVLRLLDANDHREPEAPPTLITYSPLTHEIVTAHGATLKLWDVQMGLLKREHNLADGPKAADISGLTFDARGRRLLVADRATQGCFNCTST